MKTKARERIFPGRFYLSLIIRLSVFMLTSLAVMLAIMNISKEYLIISVNLVFFY